MSTSQNHDSRRVVCFGSLSGHLMLKRIYHIDNNMAVFECRINKRVVEPMEKNVVVLCVGLCVLLYMYVYILSFVVPLFLHQ